ncbi:integrase core domain-containing protein [Pseudooceanicola nanhaiensis]|uniref:integrase core domain-containing protein n=1 Tax=Pseudooceanicola nanhaiensis TaxID=375761 RepID=UPI0040584686
MPACATHAATRRCLRRCRTRSVLDAWRHDYNHVRPHSKPGGRIPAEKAARPIRGHDPGQVAATSTNHRERAGLHL